VASGCLTEIATAPRVRDASPPSVTVVERVACVRGYAAMALIPQARELPPLPTSESGASVRAWVAACDAQAKDETRYLEEALSVARTAKDVVVLISLRDYLARVLGLRTRLAATAAVDDDADALAAHETMDRARVICEALRQMQNEARQAVAID